MHRYWCGLVLVIVASFAVLGFTGVRIYQSAPPIPDRVVTGDGREVIGQGEIAAGQNVWQAAGGMEMGSVWGHAMRPEERWNAKVSSVAFWSLNVGLFVMVGLSLLPIGLIQTWASVEHGYAYARSPELMQLPVIVALRWMRVPGDAAFTLGILTTVAFILGAGRRTPAPGSASVLPLPSVPRAEDTTVSAE